VIVRVTHLPLGELVSLMHRWPGMTLHGFRVIPERHDERVVIEGFNHPEAPRICMEEGLKPDELSSNRIWWD
jgi:hypothetical protein